LRALFSFVPALALGSLVLAGRSDMLLMFARMTPAQPINDADLILMGAFGLGIDAWLILAAILTVSTMRKANGYRAPQ
jgi:hypothetical protein